MKKETIFYIEDNFQNRILIQRFLEFEGFEVYSAETGQEGLKRSKEILPDVFLVDLNLPDMSGVEVIRALSNQAETRDIPKIAFSGEGAYTARQALPAGRIFYMAKPVDMDQLADKLRFAMTCPDNSETFVL